MNKTMKALVKPSIEPGQLIYTDVPIPEPAPGQVRIKIVRSGICQTDNVYVNDGGFALRPPVILGHEISGYVDKLGEGVTQWKVGERVITQTTYHVCGHCRYCKVGEYNHCPERQGIGSAKNGGFAEYVVNRAESLMHLPDELTFDQGAVVEPLSCGVHSLSERCTVSVNDVVVVIGPGPIGLFTAQVAKAQGATVIMAGMTRDEPRLVLAHDVLGMDRVVNVEKEDLIEVAKSYTDGYGADVVVEAAGSRAATDLAMLVVRRRGTFVPMGVFNHPIEIDFHNIKKKELTVYGSHAQIPTSWEKALKLIARGKINVDPIISHVLPMSQYKEAFELVDNKQGLKVLLDPSK